MTYCGIFWRCEAADRVSQDKDLLRRSAGFAENFQILSRIIAESANRFGFPNSKERVSTESVLAIVVSISGKRVITPLTSRTPA